MIVGAELSETEKLDLVLSLIQKHYEVEKSIKDIPKKYQKELESYAYLKEAKRMIGR